MVCFTEGMYLLDCYGGWPAQQALWRSVEEELMIEPSQPLESGEAHASGISNRSKKSFDAIIAAEQRDPMVICRQKHDVAVVLSMEEYESLRSINIKVFKV